MAVASILHAHPTPKPRLGRLSVVIPCYNEEDAIGTTLRRIRETLDGFLDDYEIIAFNDGSTDGTPERLLEAAASDERLIVLGWETNRGYGAALKAAIHAAGGEWVLITDADGTYPIDQIPNLLERAPHFDMVVGARTGRRVHYSSWRKIPKFFLTLFASWVARCKIPDINSGLRVFRKELALKYLHILPEGFSFTTTITIALLTDGYRVHYHPIDYSSRVGLSKIKPVRDTLGFFHIILRTCLYFNPLRAFAPVNLFLLAAFLASFLYDAIVSRNITDKTALLLTVSINTFFFSLIADLIVRRTKR